MDIQELLGTLSAKWGRQLVHYTDDIYLVYADEALTGFTLILDPPKIGEFKGSKCVLVSLAYWMVLTALSSQTVTPFRVVAVGKSIIVGAWRPHTGLKYAIRNTEHGAMLHIPITEFTAID